MLFPENNPNINNDHAPLAERIRPIEYGDLLGQEAIWSPTSPLRKIVEQDKFYSLIFWGAPGTGKTTLALMIGRAVGRPVTIMSAVHSGVREIRQELDRSQQQIDSGLRASLIFLDELHRLNKAQQDILLPALESGQIKFIGATSENPSFRVNPAINSRSLTFHFEPLKSSALIEILHRAVKIIQPEDSPQRILDEVITSIADSSGGDARKALNLLDAILCCCQGQLTDIGLDDLKEHAATLALRYDRDGSDHYDLAAALIKSIRASHPDAAIYYLARMLEGGEDPVFIARRLVIAASEDIGNANPTALLIATSGMQSIALIGMPEARIILAQVTTYLAASPKSNKAYLAIDKAIADVKKYGSLEVPITLRNAPTQLMKDIGYGKEYVYPHDDLENAKKMYYLPTELRGRKYYEATDFGAERQLKATLAQLRPLVD